MRSGPSWPDIQPRCAAKRPGSFPSGVSSGATSKKASVLPRMMAARSASKWSTTSRGRGPDQTRSPATITWSNGPHARHVGQHGLEGDARSRGYPKESQFASLRLLNGGVELAAVN